MIFVGEDHTAYANHGNIDGCYGNEGKFVREGKYALAFLEVCGKLNFVQKLTVD